MSRKKTKPHVFKVGVQELWLLEGATDMRATVDDVVEALRAAPFEVRDEFDRKLRRRLEPTKPALPTLLNVPLTSDMREACKGIARWSDKELRRFRTHFVDSEHPIIGMVLGLCDEIMRMRRDLRAHGISTPYMDKELDA